MPKKRQVATQRKEIVLPTELVNKAELLAIPVDALRMKQKYGAWSQYIEGLVRQDIEQRLEGVKNVDTGC